MRHPAAHLVSIAVITALAWYYFIYQGFPISVGFTNAVVAFASAILLTASFALGPFSRLPRLKRARIYRKEFGLWGYSLAALHTLLAAWAVMDAADPIAYSDAMSLAFAAVAFMIFTLLAMTSTPTWVRGLGYQNWKMVQRTGYLALVFVLIHIVLLEQGVFLTRIVGQITTTFILAVLLVRMLVVILQLRDHRRQTQRRRERARERATTDESVGAPDR